MNWKRIAKEASIPPTKGSYSDWKPQLSVEGYHQCVYCTITELSFGGIRNFHVEHYRPKGIPAFAHLENTYSNLFYACAICNSFKSDDWPADPDGSFAMGHYPDPSQVDYNMLFSIQIPDTLISGKNVTGVYLVNKLYLNRPQLLIDRKEVIIEAEYKNLMQVVQKQQEQLFDLAEKNDREALALLRELSQVIASLEKTYHDKMNTIPYSANQTSRN